MFFVDETNLIRYSFPTMKGRTRLGIILVGLAIIVGIGWQWTRDSNSISFNTYPGLVNSESLDIPEDVRAQWEVQLNTGVAILETEPDNLGVLQSLAVIQESLGEYAIARRYIERYMEINAMNPASWTILGDIALRMEDYKTAEAAFVKALSLVPNEQGYFKLEALWRAQFPDRYADIETMYQEAIQLDRQRPSYMTRLARWYAEQERWQEAVDHMAIVAQLQPDETGVATELAEYKSHLK